jgi:hypothetical protein
MEFGMEVTGREGWILVNVGAMFVVVYGVKAAAHHAGSCMQPYFLLIPWKPQQSSL